MLQAIIFDMDWVLVDSAWYIFKSFVKAFEKYWIDIQSSDKRKYLWRSLEDQFKMRKDEFNITMDISLEDFSKEAYRCQLELMKDVLVSDDNVQQLIMEAKSQWIKISVATSSFKYRAVDMLQLVWVYNHLDVLVTCEDVENNKPSPDIFLKAAELIQIKPENCLVIEDALNGIQAAKSANMKAVAKLWQHHTKEDFISADFIFSDFSEISLPILQKLF